jgi:small subunit ribosomal protein S8
VQIENKKFKKFMVNDTISDMLTRIRNPQLVKHETVCVLNTKTNTKISHILKKEGYIDSFNTLNDSKTKLEIHLKYLGHQKKPCITNLKRLSSPGLRLYSNYKEIPSILGGRGLVILSTSSGIMTDREARANKVGGEVLCSIW